MSPRKHHRRHAHDLASLYALGALNPRDREKFEEHIEMCASSVQEVTSLLPATHRLAATAPRREAPAAMRERVLQGITGEVPVPVDAQTNGDARGDAEAAVAVAASTAPATVTGDEPAGDAQAAEDAPGAEHGRRQTVIDDLTIDTSVGAESGAPSSGTRRAGRWALWLVTLASLGAAGGAGWQWMQQMAYTVALQENLDAANQEAMLSQEDSIAAREQTETVRAQMAILNAPNMETLHLEGQPAAPDASARWISSDTAGTLFSAAGLPPPPPGRSYQLWFVANDAPISGGMLTVDDAGRIAASVAPPIQDGTGGTPLVPMAVTLEPEEGVEAPTGEVYLLGRP